MCGQNVLTIENGLTLLEFGRTCIDGHILTYQLLFFRCTKSEDFLKFHQYIIILKIKKNFFFKVAITMDVHMYSTMIIHDIMSIQSESELSLRSQSSQSERLQVKSSSSPEA